MKNRLMSSGMVLGLGLLWATTAMAEDESEFARETIDLGTVVGDVEKSVAFYKDVIGFTELDGFDVPAGFAKSTGLTNNLPFHVHVLVLGKGETATKLKLMQFKTAPGARIDQSYLHSTYGFRYLTIFVKDLAKSLERAAKQGVKPIAQGPQTLPEGFPQDLSLVVFRDPDGNFVELVGPGAK
jgi:catechol 2,3-dioxygenase-like lactoylglutathione lyase family enzyme